MRKQLKQKNNDLTGWWYCVLFKGKNSEQTTLGRPGAAGSSIGQSKQQPQSSADKTRVCKQILPIPILYYEDRFSKKPPSPRGWGPSSKLWPRAGSISGFKSPWAKGICSATEDSELWPSYLPPLTQSLSRHGCIPGCHPHILNPQPRAIEGSSKHTGSRGSMCVVSPVPSNPRLSVVTSKKEKKKKRNLGKWCPWRQNLLGVSTKKQDKPIASQPTRRDPDRI